MGGRDDRKSLRAFVEEKIYVHRVHVKTEISGELAKKIHAQPPLSRKKVLLKIRLERIHNQS